MACNPLITDPFVFPRRVTNRPGLPRIAYRIGRYADFVEAMRRGIDAAPELAAWTHREADDPGIAILEGAAMLGDILTFYQEHYANEAYLRTAAWRESVAELVRLTGYRLAPGIGGRATLAFEARGTTPLTIPEGFAVKAELDGRDQPADFQTDAELVAWPHLGRFHLYRPRVYAATIAAGATAFELATPFDIKAGDRLLLQPPEPSWTSGGTTLTAQQEPQVVTVKAVTSALGRTVVTIDAPLQAAWNQPAAAYRINRTFRHLGHNAPPKTVTNSTTTGGTITGAVESTTGFVRHVEAGHDCLNTSASMTLTPALLPLDTEVPDLERGMRVVVQTRVTRSGVTQALSVVRTVATIEARTVGFGNLTGPSSLLHLNQPLVKHAMSGSPQSDVRDYRIHEVTSPPLTVRPVSSPSGAGFTNGTNVLRFWGTAVEARALAGRRLHLSHADGRSVELTCTKEASHFPVPTPDVPTMWPLSFDRPPSPFVRADFDETAPTVTVLGNLVDASQGKAEREAVLGNGDHRERWQTFPLPKAPLTYFLAPGGIPAHAPELEIWVGGRLWTRVDAFFGHGPDDQVYIVREDAAGKSLVQFGDGETGARLPSGLKNVVAIYRTGTGAYGVVKAGSTPTASERPRGFDKVSVAGLVSGGAEPEEADKAREAAPGKVQSLGRLVSIRDYETETLAVPGVVTATARWDLHAGVPAVILRVLLDAGREAEFDAVRATLAHAQRCHGPDRFPLIVQQARLRYGWVDVSLARDGSYRREDVEAAVRATVAGLFGLHSRRLGDREYATRIEGRLQQVAGIVWCRVTAMGRFAASATNPDVLVLPAAPRPAAAVMPCSPDELLLVADRHLTLTEVAAPAGGECA